MTNSKLSAEYGLIGYPLIHSFSKDYFNQKFSCEQINAKYINFEIEKIDDIKNVLIEHPLLNGLNVTIPYKEQVIKYLDELDDDARSIGAVNVIKFIKSDNGDTILKGFNSDIIGFIDSINPLLKNYHKSALVLGTGGASKAIAHGLEKLGLKVQFVSRTKSDNHITYEELDESIMSKYNVIVNTTPVGMYPHTEECPAIPYNLLTSNHLCYDLLYNPDETLFMKKAKEHGATVKNGLEMLLLQAFAAWNIWQK